jgi:hypothetical protein
MLDADPAADEVELQAKLEQARIRKLNFLIVTLPDPIDSSLGYAFDEAVNTLQTAVGTQRFLIDRFYLVPVRKLGSSRFSQGLSLRTDAEECQIQACTGGRRALVTDFEGHTAPRT